MLQSDTGSAAVRVRNVSALGALLQGKALPPIGTDVRLTKGDLSAFGVLTWKRGDQAGLRFVGNADVNGWIPNRKAEQSGSRISAKPASPSSPIARSRALAERLASVADLLADVLADIAADRAPTRATPKHVQQLESAIGLVHESIREL
jgi:hypothetical protein